MHLARFNDSIISCIRARPTHHSTNPHIPLTVIANQDKGGPVKGMPFAIFLHHFSRTWCSASILLLLFNSR